MRFTYGLSEWGYDCYVNSDTLFYISDSTKFIIFDVCCVLSSALANMEWKVVSYSENMLRIITSMVLL